MVAAGIGVVSMLVFNTSVHQFFAEVVRLLKLVAYSFGVSAGFMAVGSCVYSQLVERIRARRVSHGALSMFILLSGVHVAIATAGFENAWSFCALQAATM